MNKSNPYQSPPEITESQVSGQRLSKHWAILYWFGVSLVLTGTVAIFTPNFPALGSLLIAMTLFLIVVIGSKRYRKLAFAALLVTIFVSGGAVVQMGRMRIQTARQRAIDAERVARQAAAEASRQNSRQALTPDPENKIEQ